MSQALSEIILFEEADFIFKLALRAVTVVRVGGV